MKKETQGKVKKTAATAASAVAGAATGVFFGSAISAEAAENQEPIEAEIAEDQSIHTQNAARHTAHSPSPQQETEEIQVESVVVTEQTDDEIRPGDEDGNPNPMEETDPVEPLIGDPDPVVEPSLTEGNIEVLSYERIPTGEGGEMDVAVLDVNGTEVAVVDFDLDGVADTMACDFNQNGIIEDGESIDIQDQGISMFPFQDAAGFNPDLAQNQLPDYMNDADVDNYMA